MAPEESSITPGISSPHRGPSGPSPPPNRRLWAGSIPAISPSSRLCPRLPASSGQPDRHQLSRCHGACAAREWPRPHAGDVSAVAGHRLRDGADHQRAGTQLRRTAEHAAGNENGRLCLNCLMARRHRHCAAVDWSADPDRRRHLRYLPALSGPATHHEVPTGSSGRVYRRQRDHRHRAQLGRQPGARRDLLQRTGRCGDDRDQLEPQLRRLSIDSNSALGRLAAMCQRAEQASKELDAARKSGNSSRSNRPRWAR